MHPFVKKTLEDLIYKILLYSDYLLFRPGETIGEIKPETFIDFTKNEIKSFRLEFEDMQYVFEKLDENSSEDEKNLFNKTYKCLIELYDFLFYESISRPKTFRVYESYIEREYLEKIRYLRFEALYLKGKL